MVYSKKVTHEDVNISHGTTGNIGLLTMNTVESIFMIPIEDYYWAPNNEDCSKHC